MSSLYLHIPFCQRKCDYCDFYSAELTEPETLQNYVDLLRLELTLLANKYPVSEPLDTVFLGGGTPSLLAATQITSILQQTAATFNLSKECEISLEANPGTINLEKLQGYRQAGINRLSLGVQTLNNKKLQNLGRIHSAEEARRAVSLAREAGFDNLNLDLIFALPEQTPDQLSEDIDAFLVLQPQHLSLYGLSFEPGTPLEKRLQAGLINEADEQFYADSYRSIHQRLESAGFEHYEISNFARPGYRCRHNQVYWNRQPCLAVGCGAHSFIADGWGTRWATPANLTTYRSKLDAGILPMERIETFDRKSAMAEFVYLALRTADGLSRRAFQQHFNCTPETEFTNALRQAKERLTLVDEHWRFDLQGWLLYDHLISPFL